MPASPISLCIHGKLGHIKIIDASAVYQFPAVSIITADGIDLLSCIFCHAGITFAKRFLSAQGQISSGNIQTGKQQIGRAGRLRQVDDLAYILPSSHSFLVRSRELCVRLPPDLCMETDAISAPASIAHRPEDSLQNTDAFHAPHPPAPACHVACASFNDRTADQNRSHNRSGCSQEPPPHPDSHAIACFHLGHLHSK